ncbi:MULTISPECIES: MerR family transcriptional regulator [unclassified Marinobacterium]|jgi:DNA-binding transcriptional MerR regulator|uniref:MerR family transcriptional regulator n=1 Tax=unclassified Marinobacterium TaxID=2644139 RepID=UPI0015694FD8|nr:MULTISPECIES: MerR family transcriptional regulator [unclassified Marinobacterium]NRP11000.1 HTH-type transcriptional regulator GlnR [Marinobacterium sp. xm-g-48]NRP16313.1 HTH-type transcriptional regulator GlnR [Marinobacterium sp. xm-a-152]NRP27083.1 HTH-type transcriptional regulator GlnR [Marinobacterium sp. xm-d-420]NRP36522.1 HTH-type transcriptional regulator GlnR [Marinobacterium sp. xm-d-579]NRP39039.1 HTH-type transcriptional regulator GlnR [Marinobacterium sp. xm-a-121]
MSSDLPTIPTKRYFTIGEVSKLCDLKPHVLRYWEQEFEQIEPVKRSNRRYYQHQDILLIREIKGLLYEQGLTIAGAKQYLTAGNTHDDQGRYKQLIRQSITELEDILKSMRINAN